MSTTQRTIKASWARHWPSLTTSSRAPGTSCSTKKSKSGWSRHLLYHHMWPTLTCSSRRSSAATTSSCRTPNSTSWFTCRSLSCSFSCSTDCSMGCLWGVWASACAPTASGCSCGLSPWCRTLVVCGSSAWRSCRCCSVSTGPSLWCAGWLCPWSAWYSSAPSACSRSAVTSIEARQSTSCSTYATLTAPTPPAGTCCYGLYWSPSSRLRCTASSSPTPARSSSGSRWANCWHWCYCWYARVHFRCTRASCSSHMTAQSRRYSSVSTAF